jgi:cytochrome c oxidase subunit 4
MDQHIAGYRSYFAVFITLLLLTLVTVDVAFFNAGWLNLPMALFIAVCKATLVILYFMHVRHADHLTWIFVAMGFLWLIILLALLMSDYVGQRIPV